MRSIIRLLIMIFISALHISSSAASVIDSIITGGAISFSENTTLTDSAIIDVNKINITKPIYLENAGTIYGDIFICDDCDLMVRNSGTINGSFHAGDNSHITQVIKSSGDITRLDFGNSAFSVLVQGDEEVFLSDILRISVGADKIILDNTSILLGPGLNRRPRLRLVYPAIELVGKITIKLEDLKDLNGRPILSNVSGDGLVYFDIPNLDPLYVASPYRKDNDIYIQINRETDYVKILGQNYGIFINKVREIAPDNLTVNALDGAATMNDFMDIASRSVMLNPINLMRPIKLFNRFEMNTFSPGANLGMESVFITNNDLSLKAGKVSTSMKSKNLDLTASAYAGFFDNSDDINIFSGIVYGGNIRAAYDTKSIFINAIAGASMAKFNTDIIFDGRNLSFNPTGAALYSAFDFGSKYKFNQNFLVKAFLGIVAEYESVLNQKNSSVLGRIGGEAVYRTEENGIRYDYKFLGSLETDGIITAGIGMFFWSNADSAGGGASYKITRDDFGVSHQIAVEAKFMF